MWCPMIDETRRNSQGKRVDLKAVRRMCPYVLHFRKNRFEPSRHTEIRLKWYQLFEQRAGRVVSCRLFLALWWKMCYNRTQMQ